jgi:hypothetical protein
MENKQEGFRKTLNELTTSRNFWREVAVILLVLLFLLIGMGASSMAKYWMGMGNDTVLAAFVIIPLLAYAVLAGKIQGFKALGIEAQFIQTAAEPVRTMVETVETTRMDVDIQFVSKISPLMDKIEEMKAQLREDRPIVLTIELGNSNYTQETIRKYITVLSHFRNFKFVVFRDFDKRFVAFMPSWTMKTLLGEEKSDVEKASENQTNSNQFAINPPAINQPDKNKPAEMLFKYINDPDIANLLHFPGVVQDTVRLNDDLKTALREMTRQHIEALVVIDSDRKVCGIVEREQIISKMMLALAD